MKERFSKDGLLRYMDAIKDMCIEFDLKEEDEDIKDDESQVRE